MTPFEIFLFGTFVAILAQLFFPLNPDMERRED
jgi:hypothetical protein